MLRNVHLCFVACLLLGVPCLLKATPLAAEDLHQPVVRQPAAKILSAGELLGGSQAAVRDAVGSDDEIGELTPTEGAQLGTTGTGLGPADRHPTVMSGPSEGALWIYALGGCAAVGLVAFRSEDKKD